MISINLPVGILAYLRTQGVQEQAKQVLYFSLNLFISQDAIIHVSLYTALDTALSFIDCTFPLLILFISGPILSCLSLQFF